MYNLFRFQLLAVVRANIAALGGNAMVSFYQTELILFDNQHKNQVNIKQNLKMIFKLTIQLLIVFHKKGAMPNKYWRRCCIRIISKRGLI